MEDESRMNSSMEIADIGLGRVLQMASGKAENSFPNASAILALDQVMENGNVTSSESISFSNAEFQFFLSDGCVVVQADFGREQVAEFNHVVSVCEKYLGQNPTQGNNDSPFLVLSLVLVPMKFFGEMYIVFQNLVYSAGFIIPGGERLVLCFDNVDTEVYETDDIDYDRLVEVVQREEKRIEDKLRAEQDALQSELDRLNNRNIYAAAIHTQYGVADHRAESTAEIRTGMRIAKDVDLM